MKMVIPFIVILLSVQPIQQAACEPVDMDYLIATLRHSISGERARDYTMRLWQYEKWYTQPMQKKSAAEAVAIMRERGFDEADIVNTSADGVTRYGTWTNPVGWDVSRATLEVVEPPNLPDEYRYLCNYSENPTSLIGWSCPTPPDGLEIELVMLDRANENALRSADVRGKMILIQSGPGSVKQYMDAYGIQGVVSDYIESSNSDFRDANTWQNTWSDSPGGWMMNASDNPDNFGFMISQKKADYLRNLLRRKQKVVVRATIDSRYFTDDVLPYVTGAVHGTGDEDVLIVGHLFEWGANDNSSGCASIIEALGTLHDLIETGVLPRPKRSIRTWLGHELYGSMAFAENNIDRLRDKTIAAVCCDTPAENYDNYTTAPKISMSLNACPSYTDAVFPEIAGRYIERFAPNKRLELVPFITGIDNFFCEPMIGVPINALSMNEGSHLHHNSMDTIEKVDPRTLRELALINAAYLYYMATAGPDDVPLIARLAYDHGISVILEKTSGFIAGIPEAADGAELGTMLARGEKTITYYTGLQKQALSKLGRLAGDGGSETVSACIARYDAAYDDFCTLQAGRLKAEVQAAARERSITVEKPRTVMTEQDRKSATIIPKRNYIGTLTFDGIPPDKWVEAPGAARWWSAGNWPAASYWWADGKRNLNEIRELMELELGAQVVNFDLVAYFTFLKEYGIVEFVK